MHICIVGSTTGSTAPLPRTRSCWTMWREEGETRRALVFFQSSPLFLSGATMGCNQSSHQVTATNKIPANGQLERNEVPYDGKILNSNSAASSSNAAINGTKGTVIQTAKVSFGSPVLDESKSCSDFDVLSDSSPNSNAASSSNNNNSNRPRTESSGAKTLRHTSSKIFSDRDTVMDDLKSKVVHIEVPFGKPIEEVYDGVHDGPVLGSGISGLVRLATHQATQVKYAVKCLDLGFIETEEGLQQLREEIYIMCQLDHPNIVRLEEVYESHTEIFLVQELCVGGELFDRLDEQPDYHYTEEQCARLVKQMLCAVRYIHSKGIVHRDLKLENFLFSTTSPDSELKMIDFGLSKHFTHFGQQHNEAVGTPYTVAPEVIRGNYDEKCDVWAIGVIAYLLLSGDPPFGGCGGPEPLMAVRQNILSGSFQFKPDDIWENVSDAAKCFITSLLVTDPKKRPTAAEAQQLVWIQDYVSSQSSNNKKLSASVVKALVGFKEYSDMRKLLCEVLSFTLLPDQITDLRAEFEKIDTDGSGEISLHALKQVLIHNASAGSLGALTEEEVEDIFHAMRVRKSEPTIQWHEFIAAGLSQCKVDDRNLRLAFDRIDSDHKGYISFDDVLDLMGNAVTEESLRSIFQDSMTNENPEDARITYEDFLFLMKGQTKGRKGEISPTGNLTAKSHAIGRNSNFPLMPSLSARNIGLEAVQECPELIQEINEDEESDSSKNSRNLTSEENASNKLLKTLSANEEEAGATSFDSDEIDLASVSSNVEMALRRYSLKSHSLIDETSPSALIEPGSPSRFCPTTTSRVFSPYTSKRSRLMSRSFDEKDLTYSPEWQQEQEEDENPVGLGAAVIMALPEHSHESSIVTELINDPAKTPLVVNRELYRTHRLMRLAVLEASKRFEEKKVIRVQMEMNKRPARTGAGLVMRHGLQKQMSSNAIRSLLREREKQTQQQIDEIVKRTGRERPRRNRKKTVSDMTGFLTSPGNPKLEE